MLVAAGAVVGVATVASIATGYEIQLTPHMIQLLTYKAFGAAAIGLIIVGTWIGRGGSAKHRDASRDAQGGNEALREGPAAAALPDRTSVKMDVRQGR